MSNESIVSDYYDFDQTHFLTLTQYRIVGGIIFTYVTAALLLHIPVMWIFITKKEFYENSTYILMFHLGLGDIFVIVDWQLACLMMIFPKKFTPTATTIGWLTSAIDNCSFITPNLFIFALAIMRFIIMTETLYLSKSVEKFLCHTMTVIIYITYIVFFVLIAKQFQPQTEINVDNSIFDLDGRSGNVKVQESWLSIAMFYVLEIPLFISIVLYIGVIIKLLIRRYMLKESLNILKGQERVLLVQTMVPCVLKLGLQCFWNYCFVEGQLGQCFQLIVLCLDCGYDPIVYICVNKRLRFQMRRALGMQATTTIEVTPFAS